MINEYMGRALYSMKSMTDELILMENTLKKPMISVVSVETHQRRGLERFRGVDHVNYFFLSLRPKLRAYNDNYDLFFTLTSFNFSRTCPGINVVKEKTFT